MLEEMHAAANATSSSARTLEGVRDAAESGVTGLAEGLGLGDGWVPSPPFGQQRRKVSSDALRDHLERSRAGGRLRSSQLGFVFSRAGSSAFSIRLGNDGPVWRRERDDSPLDGRLRAISAGMSTL